MPKDKGYGSKKDNPKTKPAVSVKDAKKGFGADKREKSKAKMRNEAYQQQD